MCEDEDRDGPETDKYGEYSQDKKLTHGIYQVLTVCQVLCKALETNYFIQLRKLGHREIE